MNTWHAFRMAVAFLTRFSLPRFAGKDPSPEHHARSVGFYPLVGLGLGGLTAGAGWVLTLAGLPPLAVGVLMTAWLAWLSAGLHLDGLADTFDGLGARIKGRPAALAAMTDSASGPMGTAALVLVLVLKAALLGQLAVTHQWWGLLLAPAVGRWSAVGLMAALPPAKNQGLGHGVGTGVGWRVWATAGLLAGAVTGGLGYTVGLGTHSAAQVATESGPQLAIPLAAGLLGALGAALGLGRIARRAFGGVTGDVCGAGIELSETAFLAGWMMGPTVSEWLYFW
ncbi:MAG: adenosylcobinamide-GDP ribazoletransferase [Deltaproteobacteria bacterium]|nr:adenosylcobinamide-GDP ribazoletransferase [Deltaproteobacteria bacterium]